MTSAEYLKNNSILGYGKHANLTKESVFEKHKGYVSWVKKKEFSNIGSTKMKLFWIWLYANDKDYINELETEITCPLCRNISSSERLINNIKGLNEDCDICMTDKKEVYQPCGHVSFCNSCLHQMKKHNFINYYLSKIRYI